MGMGGWCMPGVCDVGVDVIMGGRLSVSFKTPLELTVKEATKIKIIQLKNTTQIVNKTEQV